MRLRGIFLKAVMLCGLTSGVGFASGDLFQVEYTSNLRGEKLIVYAPLFFASCCHARFSKIIKLPDGAQYQTTNSAREEMYYLKIFHCEDSAVQEFKKRFFKADADVGLDNFETLSFPIKKLYRILQTLEQFCASESESESDPEFPDQYEAQTWPKSAYDVEESVFESEFEF